jgi:hypothetical protein
MLGFTSLDRAERYAANVDKRGGAARVSRTLTGELLLTTGKRVPVVLAPVAIGGTSVPVAPPGPPPYTPNPVTDFAASWLSTDGVIRLAGFIRFDGAQPGGASALTLIGDQLLSGTQATFDTNTILSGNIPSTYTHLSFELYARLTSAFTNDVVRMQLNGDTAGNYDEAHEQGSASGGLIASGAHADIAATIGNFPGSAAPASRFGTSSLRMPNYKETTGMKAWTASNALIRGTLDADIFAIFFSGLWRSTSAVTRIVLTPASGSFAAGSRFSLYGQT